ncbi:MULTISPECIES: helix-turn-helix domain-containing protein [unclassified Crossiella]|uniref:helix-turn-helix domain-containing protein n=1 Tax=unclassified Crossiella TaxID=2620835 RepID=UPI001FFFCC81|nr:MULTISPECIES: helix-turn-helix domain-containing protein [unclassified Crossiella]MCK2239274.1 helix-turn-helix domain-containing protein [Crossiella sp. S99.2]MCK2251156.1 helix-turn-helix domain-containing protein [Crossiella sp. S99.1]
MGRGVLEGAFLLLEEILDTEECGLSELAARTGLPKATVHRLLDQLVRLGAVQRSEGRYRMGARMFRFGTGWRSGADLRAAALHPLRQLASALPGAGVSVAVPDGEDTLILGALGGETDDVVPLRAGLKYPAEGLWRVLIRSAGEGDGVLRVPEATCAQELAGVSAVVRTRSGEVCGAVSAWVLDQRRLPAMSAVVRHTAGLVSGQLARIRRPTWPLNS